MAWLTACVTVRVLCSCKHADNDRLILLCLRTESLHGSSAIAQLSRLIWLYLHSGEQLYMEGVKQTVLQYVHARLDISTSLWQPVLRPVAP